MPSSRPTIRDISWRRWVAYSVVSLISGSGWACIALMMLGADPRNGSQAHHLVSGALSGLLVGWLMNRFYRSPDPTAIILTAPLAYYVAVYFFIVLDALWQPTVSAKILLIAFPWALLAFAPPFVLLLPLSWFNGLLLRWTLLGLPRVKY